MIISKHAEERMKKRNITKEEIERCLVEGEIIIKKFIKGEMRYLKEVDLKDKKLIVIYTINKNGEERVITCHPKRRKRI